MDTPAGHYSVFRVPFQIDADGDCTRCGLKIEPDEDTLEPHECPPGFTDPAMSGSKGLQVPCGDCGMPCDPAEYHPYAACLMFKQCHDSETVRANLNAALRRAKAEVWGEVIEGATSLRASVENGIPPHERVGFMRACNEIIGYARAAQIERGE